ncbi:MAG: hypothetical protein ACLRVT_09070 [Oscillospiraceae bacterium]
MLKLTEYLCEGTAEYVEFEGERFPKIKEKDGVKFRLLGVAHSNGARIAEYMEIPRDIETVRANRERLEQSLNHAAQAMGISNYYELVFSKTPSVSR